MSIQWNLNRIQWHWSKEAFHISQKEVYIASLTALQATTLDKKGGYKKSVSVV